MTLNAINKLKSELTTSAQRILPDYALDVLCFTCSAATMILGENEICNILQGIRPKAYVNTVIGAAQRALKQFNVKNIVVLTPYPTGFEQYVRQYLADEDFNILSYNSFCFETNEQINNLTPNAIFQNALNLNTDEAEAIFICCGALRSLDIVNKLEQTVGKPVVCSNQAMVWDCLRHCGINDHITDYGQLLTLPA